MTGLLPVLGVGFGLAVTIGNMLVLPMETLVGEPFAAGRAEGCSPPPAGYQ